MPFQKWERRLFDVMKKKQIKMMNCCQVPLIFWDPCPQSVFFSRGQNSAHSKKKLHILRRTAADGPAWECRPLPPPNSLETDYHPHCVSLGWNHVLRRRHAVSLIVVLQRLLAAHLLNPWQQVRFAERLCGNKLQTVGGKLLSILALAAL